VADHEVVVIGTGPVGLSVAFELATRGIDVAVVEALTVGSGAARRNAGWVVPIMAAPVPAPGVVGKAARWMFDPMSPLRVAPDLDPGHIAFMFGMLRASTPRRFEQGLAAVGALAEGTLDLFAAYAGRGVDFELHRDGVLLAFTSLGEFEAHVKEYQDAALAAGLSTPELLDATGVREVEPGLAEAVVAGILCPDQMHLNPGSYVDGLRSAISAMGVPVLEGQSVSGLAIATDRIALASSHGSMSARQVVVAAGVGTSRIVASLGQRLPLRFGKGYGYDLAAPPVPLRRAVYLTEAKVAVTPLNEGMRLAGTMEFGGDPDRVDLRRAAGIITCSRPYFAAGIDGAHEPWAGLRPMTPDGLPVIGRMRRAPGVIVATGHAMLGVTLAPRTGQLVADLVEGKPQPPELAPFAIERFQRGKGRRNPTHEGGILPT
jgi:D-amino-acid dehydrogenase